MSVLWSLSDPPAAAKTRQIRITSPYTAAALHAHVSPTGNALSEKRRSSGDECAACNITAVCYGSLVPVVLCGDVCGEYLGVSSLQNSLVIVDCNSSSVFESVNDIP
jgi:hypothetical protein